MITSLENSRTFRIGFSPGTWVPCATSGCVLFNRWANLLKLFKFLSGEDGSGRIVIREARGLVLTAREFDLHEYLFRHQRRIISREMLARDLWKETARDSDTQLEFSLETAVDKSEPQNACTAGPRGRLDFLNPDV